MEPRFQTRLDEMRRDARVPARLAADLPQRLAGFLGPFAAVLCRQEQRHNALCHVQGLLSGLGRKNAEAIAYLHGQGRQASGSSSAKPSGATAPSWPNSPARSVATWARTTPSSSSILPPSPRRAASRSAWLASGADAWARWTTAAVGVFLAYVSRKEHALAYFRLYLPKEWKRKRCSKAGVPRGVGFRTRHEPALDMLDSRRAVLPHAWIAGDDEMGRGSWFRKELRTRGENYLLDVPSNTLARDLGETAPPYSGRGRRPEPPFRRVDRLAASLPESAWQTVQGRDGEKGPVTVRLARVLVQAKEEGSPSETWEMLVVFREEQSDGSVKRDCLLGHGALGKPVAELARVFKARHRIEECLERAKGEAGLGDCQVRTWQGWHHHMTLSLMAAWFLTGQTRRGKKADPRADGAGLGPDAGRAAGARAAGAGPLDGVALAGAQRGGEAPPLASSQLLAA